jgi:hypothetical protein
MLRPNGTLYWQNQSNPDIKFDLTEQQVDFFNISKNKIYPVKNTDLKKYQFTDEEKEKKYIEDCEYLNKLRNFLIKINPAKKLAIHNEEYRVIMVGPRFRQIKDLGPEQTPGFLYSVYNESNEIAPSSHEGNFTGKRQWVILSHNYPLNQTQEERGSISIPNINPSDIYTDIRSALKGVLKHGIPASRLPSEETIEAIDSEYKHRQDVAKINKDKAESQFSEFTSATEPVPQNEISDLASDDFSKTEESPVDVNSLVEDEDDLFNPKNAFENKKIKEIIFKKANLNK